MDAPNLSSVAPELALELRQLLLKEGEADLAAKVHTLKIVDRCRCGDSFCGSFSAATKPEKGFGPDHRTIALTPKSGYLNVDVVGRDIFQVEVLYRDELRKKIHSAVP
jgi:hypothetical protein